VTGTADIFAALANPDPACTAVGVTLPVAPPERFRTLEGVVGTSGIERSVGEEGDLL
jgi:hypothetical protein